MFVMCSLSLYQLQGVAGVTQQMASLQLTSLLVSYALQTLESSNAVSYTCIRLNFPALVAQW